MKSGNSIAAKPCEMRKDDEDLISLAHGSLLWMSEIESAACSQSLHSYYSVGVSVLFPDLDYLQLSVNGELQNVSRRCFIGLLPAVIVSSNF
jgi:hypothetical protein